VHRALQAELQAVQQRRGEAPPRVLDVGGGSGVWAVQLAASGCEVTVVEPSPNALATLQRRAADAGATERITPLQGDVEALADLVPEAAADLVLGHGVLERVDDVAAGLAALRAAATPGGAVSVLVANRYAAILHKALAGRLSDALHLLTDDDSGGTEPITGDAMLRRFDTDGLQAALDAAGLKIELLQGDGVVADLVPGSVLESFPTAADSLAELELLAAGRPPLRDLASRLHAIARRPV
jgi:SAM-dependent methyltransferase